jgi:hypothetical protein
MKLSMLYPSTEPDISAFLFVVDVTQSLVEYGAINALPFP